MRLTVATLCVIAGVLQGKEVVDFLQVMTSYDKTQADSAVTRAFERAGLTVITNTPDLMEAEERKGSAFGGGKIERVVRATVTVGDSTGIHFTAEEITHDRKGWITKRKRLSSKDHGDNGKFWEKVTAIVAGLDSAAHHR